MTIMRQYSVVRNLPFFVHGLEAAMTKNVEGRKIRDFRKSWNAGYRTESQNETGAREELNTTPKPIVGNDVNTLKL